MKRRRQQLLLFFLVAAASTISLCGAKPQHTSMAEDDICDEDPESTFTSGRGKTRTCDFFSKPLDPDNIEQATQKRRKICNQHDTETGFQVKRICPASCGKLGVGNCASTELIRTSKSLEQRYRFVSGLAGFFGWYSGGSDNNLEGGDKSEGIIGWVLGGSGDDNSQGGNSEGIINWVLGSMSPPEDTTIAKGRKWRRQSTSIGI